MRLHTLITVWKAGCGATAGSTHLGKLWHKQPTARSLGAQPLFKTKLSSAHCPQTYWTDTRDLNQGISRLLSHMLLPWKEILIRLKPG